VKDNFCEELEYSYVFHNFPKYHMKLMLGEFSIKVGKEDIFKQAIRNESIHEISNNYGVRVVTLPHPKISLSKVQYYHIVPFINLHGHVLIERFTIKLTIF
jgi:hypothetical protein